MSGSLVVISPIIDGCLVHCDLDTIVHDGGMTASLHPPKEKCDLVYMDHRFLHLAMYFDSSICRIFCFVSFKTFR